jgi:alpha-1,3/alpha-1,6-mannosyltransferase
MDYANAVAVNSKFTKGVVSETWPRLAKSKDFEIVYPCINIKQGREADDLGSPPLAWRNIKILLSINRFEKKKNVALAVEAYAGLPRENRRGVRLVIAGICS